MTQKMYDKAVNRCFLFDSISNQYKAQEMWDRVVPEDPFSIVYCPGKYITQRMCDEAVELSSCGIETYSRLVCCKKND